MGRRRQVRPLTLEGGVYAPWVLVRVQTTVEYAGRSQSLEVVRWLPVHPTVRLGATLTLPDSGAVRWVVLELGATHRGRPTGDYVGQRLPARPAAHRREAPSTPVMPPMTPPSAPLPPPTPTLSLSQTSDRIRDRQARRLETLAEPERRIAWRKAIAAALQRRRDAGLPIGRQVEQHKRLLAQLGAGTPPDLPPA